tara:strand:- start:184 stop:984 length:801 start_codon:yes stop_codon:yes gene_type:complete
MPNLSPAAEKAFSLVELSIVLVILGLLTGGILTGQSLIRAAELRSVTTQVQQIKTAALTFRDKYFALPGDMKNATDFWKNANIGNVGGECTAPGTDTGSGTQTCNGNGDGQIKEATTTATGFEAFRAWQHLANAGLIEGNYTGISANTTNRDALAGQNIPATKLSNGGIYIRYLGSVISNPNSFDGNYGNALLIGADDAASGLPASPLFKSEELWNLDKKLDDGQPGYGFVRTYKPANSPDCAIDAQNYDLGKNTTACSLHIITGL